MINLSVINKIKAQLQSAMMSNLLLSNLSSVAVYSNNMVNLTLYGKVMQFDCYATITDVYFDESVLLNNCYYYRINAYIDKGIAQAVEGYGNGTVFTINIVL